MSNTQQPASITVAQLVAWSLAYRIRIDDLWPVLGTGVDPWDHNHGPTWGGWKRAKLKPPPCDAGS